MSLPDNRIRLSSGKIDFDNDVGVTGQDHDNYPPPQGQVRYDHMRMVLIGLLSQQSSFDPPTQYRDGTPWFDLNTLSLKVNMNGQWSDYSDAIKLGDTSLSDWYNVVNTAISSIEAECFFAGNCQTTTSTIPIPSNIQSRCTEESRVFLTVNGLSIDPREVSLIGSPYPTSIQLNTLELEANDNYFVSIRKIPSATYIQDNININ